MTIDKAVFESNQTLIPYFTYADPNPEFTESLVRESFDNGADIIEVGIPFSESLADGPVIQNSHFRALKNKGHLLNGALDMVARIKQDIQKPIVLMSAYNLIYQQGVEVFFKKAGKKGVDAVIIPDLPFEGSEWIRHLAKASSVDLIFLITPQSDQKRIEVIAKASRGFIYVVSVTGITGEKKMMNHDAKDIAAIAKRVTKTPIAIGFGISQPDHVKTVCGYADAAIVGSAFTRLIEDHLNHLNLASKKIGLLLKKMKAK